MDKKTLIITVISLAVLLATILGAVVIFTKTGQMETGQQDIGQEVQDDNLPQNNNPQDNNLQADLDLVGDEADSGSNINNVNNTGLSVCVDKCGNGICQPQDSTCKNSLNCVCPETPIDCPQDCK